MLRDSGGVGRNPRFGRGDGERRQHLARFVPVGDPLLGFGQGIVQVLVGSFRAGLLTFSTVNVGQSACLRPLRRTKSTAAGALRYRGWTDGTVCVT